MTTAVQFSPYAAPNFANTQLQAPSLPSTIQPKAPPAATDPTSLLSKNVQWKQILGLPGSLSATRIITFPSDFGDEQVKYLVTILEQGDSPELEQLTLANCNITDVSVPALEKLYNMCPRFCNLDLTNTKVTDKAINPRSPLWKLNLNLTHCYNITPIADSGRVTMVGCGMRVSAHPDICDQDGDSLGTAEFRTKEVYKGYLAEKFQAPSCHYKFNALVCEGKTYTDGGKPWRFF